MNDNLLTLMSIKQGRRLKKKNKVFKIYLIFFCILEGGGYKVNKRGYKRESKIFFYYIIM